MNQGREAPLGRAYYGPPIPREQRYEQRNRSCYCCLLSTLIKTFIAFCLALGITALVLWLVFRPNRVEVSVEKASLTSFNLTATSPTNLHYNLSADISIRNPNKKIGIYYDWLEADPFYQGHRFDWQALPSFYQGHKNTTMLYPVFEGNSAIGLGVSDVEDFNKENKTSFFNVDIWLFGQVRYKFGSVTTRRYTMRVKCELGLPLLANPAASFTRTECDVVDY
ncbi:NDR1/HIN1-like protein 10 [Cocos nucifera]|uniref:NDR1/HIN1-like protein 10 n=1 Tax=Cocos nucifera TaxID=13894 RepID=A0A8K0NDU0_COCNU|nr:NDR1/HIN1-like protein 10 [Cocos nucifera]